MISREEVIHIAKLARLELTDQEIEKMQKDMSAILDYFNVLKKVKISKSNKIVHGSQVLILTNKHLRKDEAVERPASLANNLVQAAPDKKEGYIKVKSIL